MKRQTHLAVQEARAADLRVAEARKARAEAESAQ